MEDISITHGGKGHFHTEHLLPASKMRAKYEDNGMMSFSPRGFWAGRTTGWKEHTIWTRSDPGKKRTFRLSPRFCRPGSDPQPCCRTTFLAPLGAPSGLHQDHLGLGAIFTVGRNANFQLEVGEHHYELISHKPMDDPAGLSACPGGI